MTIRIGYWKIRALVAPIEYLLKVADVPFEVKKYEFKGEAGDEGLLDNWLSEKETLGLDFPNLPYCIDGDVKITQSLAIMRYLARKAGLYGVDANAPPAVLARLDMIEQQVNDLRWNYIYYGAAQSVTGIRFPEGFPASTVRQLNPVSSFLGSNNFLMGDRVSYIDMILFEVLDVFKMINPECCSSFPNLEAYYQRVRNIPNLKKFLESEECIKWPVIGPFGTLWGWKKQ